MNDIFMSRLVAIFALFFDRAAIWATVSAQPLTYPFLIFVWWTMISWKIRWPAEISSLICIFHSFEISKTFLTCKQTPIQTVITEENAALPYKFGSTPVIEFYIWKRKIQVGFVWTHERILHEYQYIHCLYIQLSILQIYYNSGNHFKNCFKQLLTFRPDVEPFSRLAKTIYILKGEIITQSK